MARKRHPSDYDSFKHIPAKDRECVRIGIARLFPNHPYKLKYDWPAIRELWLVDPAQSIREFAEKYQIAHASLVADGKLSAARKREVNAVIRSGFTLQMLRKMVVRATVDHQSATDRLVRVLDNLAVFSESAAIFARARMIKMDPQGNETVNVDAKSADVRHYSSIAKDVSETLKNLSEIRVNMGLDDDKNRNTIDEIVIEPPKALARRSSQVVSAPTGVAPTGTSTDAQAKSTEQASPPVVSTHPIG